MRQVPSYLCLIVSKDVFAKPKMGAGLKRKPLLELHFYLYRFSYEQLRLQKESVSRHTAFTVLNRCSNYGLQRKSSSNHRY